MWKKVAGFDKVYLPTQNHSQLVDYSTDQTRTFNSKRNDTTPELKSREDEEFTEEEIISIQQNENKQPELKTTRYGRVVRPPDRYQVVAYSAYYDALHQDDYKMQDNMKDPMASIASEGDKDTMYYHQAMKEPDAGEFIEAMIKEFQDHTDWDHWELIPIEEVPENTMILDWVWAMKRKWDIKTQRITKWKARLNIHGEQQELGDTYYETYSPVVNWFMVQLLLILSLLNKWHTR